MVVLYWCECVVVGVFNVLRMIGARASLPYNSTPKALLILLFAGHYGIFLLMTLAAIFSILTRLPGLEHKTGFDALAQLFGALTDQPGIGQATVAFFLSHGISFVLNYVVGDEYRRVAPEQLMWQPYVRLGALFLAIIVAGGFAQWLGSPLPALVVLIGLKTLFDVRGHLAEHRKFA